MQAQRNALSRLPRDPYEDQPRYLHPHGYVLAKARRTWSERGREAGRTGHDPAPPLTYWEVFEHLAKHGDDARFHPWAHKQRPMTSCPTLREARHWCDERPRVGWVAGR